MVIRKGGCDAHDSCHNLRTPINHHWLYGHRLTARVLLKYQHNCIAPMGTRPWDKYRLNERPKDRWDRISVDGYFGKMQKTFDDHNDRGFGVYVIELNPDVWEESIQRNMEKKSRRWIPSFPKDLPDPKMEKSEDWKDLDVGDIKGFLYVGQTWHVFEDRHNQHCEGGQNSSPVVRDHGCDPTQLWRTERSMIGLFNTETSLMLESWYGWALGRCGYVVYGPDFHRTHKRFGNVYEKHIGFMGEDPFW